MVRLLRLIPMPRRKMRRLAYIIFCTGLMTLLLCVLRLHPGDTVLDMLLTPVVYIDSLRAPSVRPQFCNNCFHSDFTVLGHNKDLCRTGQDAEDRVDVIILVLTTHRSVDRRQAIRETWASVTQNNTSLLRHVFLLGTSRVEREMEAVYAEQAVYKDMIVHDFVDSYFNLTLKTLAGLRWVITHCGHARFFLKTDDDMFINVPTLLDTLHREEKTLHTAVGGWCRVNTPPIRNPLSKWYASYPSYPGSIYPDYCSGTGYVSSVNVARHVISVSADIPFFHLEDVYIGMCLKKLGEQFSVLCLSEFFHSAKFPCGYKSKGRVTVRETTAEELREIWRADCSASTSLSPFRISPKNRGGNTDFWASRVLCLVFVYCVVTNCSPA